VRSDYSPVDDRADFIYLKLKLLEYAQPSPPVRPVGEPIIETELRRLIAEEFLSVIQDPRVERTSKHSLETSLVISLLAVICGADSFVAIEIYARSRKEWSEM